MAKLNEIVAWLDAELKISEIQDYPGAMNGLQLENDGEVSRVVSAVDASVAVVQEAAGIPGSLLFVHHGMFWQGAQPLTGPFFRKIKAALDGNLAIYSSHLPLDIHPDFGNNVLLAEAIGLVSVKPILIKNGWPMGVAGEWSGGRDNFAASVASAVGRDVHVCPGGSPMVCKVGVITGSAGSEVAKISALGIDSFVTGEGPHWSFIEAEERGLNVFYAGHVATETFGVRRLGEIAAERFSLDFSYLERTGGL